MRRLVSVLALVALMAVPATAAAGQPFRGEDTWVDVFCDLTWDEGGGFLNLGSSDRFGSYGYLELYDDGGFAYWGEAPSADVGAGSLAAELDLYDAEGEPAGAATAQATYEGVGDPVPYSFRDRFGNAWFRAEGTTQELAVEGSVDPDPLGIEVVGCGGTLTHERFFETQPDTRVFSGDFLEVQCEVYDGEAVAYLSIFGGALDEPAFLDLFVPTPTGDLFGGTEVMPTDLHVSFSMVDATTGQEVAEATVDGALTPTDPYSFVLDFQDGPVRVDGVGLALDGSLAVDGGLGLEFDLTGCTGFAESFKDILHSPSGPKPGTKLVANDAPAGAMPVEAGGSLREKTRNTVPDAEADVWCLDFEDFDVPALHTVWFAVTGTGGPVEVTTAGSDFDTVLAVYDASLEPVDGACSDDVFLDLPNPSARDLDAAVTFDSEAGVMYLVQVGGFPSLNPYGSLRFAVR